MYEMLIKANDGKVLRRFDLTRLGQSGKRIVIGRGEECDVRLNNGSVSRRHCEVDTGGGGEDEWVLRDLGSTHGTTVDGERIKEVDIEPGLEVHIGPAVIRFESVSARIAADIAKELGAD